MERTFKCPRCSEEKSLAIERRPNGNVECLKCFYKGPPHNFILHPNKPFVRSELDCIDGKECWAITLRLATGVCYKDIKTEFGIVLNAGKPLDIGYVNSFLLRKGYSFLSTESLLDRGGKWSVRSILDTFKDFGVVIRTTNKKELNPNIHYYEKGVLFTTYITDDIFDEEVIQIWVRN